jgi:hypothetical protein
MGASDALADAHIGQGQGKKAQAGGEKETIEHETLRDIPMGIVPARIGIR